MNKSAILLTDEQIQQFIVNGYVQVKADFDEPIHDRLVSRIDEVFELEGNMGNNILPRVPEIQSIFDHPRVHGAFVSLLGEDYILNPHRHCHLNAPGSKGQRWHKDNYTKTYNLRQPRFRWIMAFYYPQDVTPDMGPTGIIPGRHFYKGISDDDASKTTEEELGLCGEAGTVNIVHFDVFHRALANVSERNRYMLKFQFVRMKEPTAPSWDYRGDEWTTEVDEYAKPAALDVWNWLQGKRAGYEKNGADMAELLRVLEDGEEEERFRAGYHLGAFGEACVPHVLTALKKEAAENADAFLEPCPANVHGYNPTALHAANALTAVGLSAVPSIIDSLGDENWLVRLSLVDALANIGADAAEAVPDLVALLNDENDRVRRAAATALGQIGEPSCDAAPDLLRMVNDDDELMRKVSLFSLAQIGSDADGLVETLGERLGDDDRYNQFYAALALRRSPSPRAREVLLDSLFTARWCPITDANNRY